MRSRYLLLALPVVAFTALPATAQDVVFVPGTGASVETAEAEDHFDPSEDGNDADILAMADQMGNPAVQDGVAVAIERATGAMMNLPIGRFADAVERARPGTVDRRIGNDATLADVGGRDVRYLPQELGERSREAMGMMSGFAKALAVMMPEFERMGREMEESVRSAKVEAKAGRY